jgi:hypothetical protein
MAKSRQVDRRDSRRLEYNPAERRHVCGVVDSSHLVATAQPNSEDGGDRSPMTKAVTGDRTPN